MITMHLFQKKKTRLTLFVIFMLKINLQVPIAKKIVEYSFVNIDVYIQQGACTCPEEIYDIISKIF